MSKKKLMLIGGSSLVALLGFGAIFTFMVGSNDLASGEQLKIAMGLLDKGRWDLAGHIALSLEPQVDLETNSNWHYVRGVAKLQSVAEEVDSPENRRVLLDATQHLLKSEELGFPIGYLGQGQFYLGWCQFNTYHWDAAIERLRNIDQLWPEKRSDALRMEIESQLHKSPPDLIAAQQALERWRSIPGVSAPERARMDIAQANLAFLRGEALECERLLSKITGTSPERSRAQLLRARWRLAQALAGMQDPSDARSKLLDEAAEITRSLKMAADTPNDLRRQATYLSGKALRALGAFQEALSTFSAARLSSPRSAEAFAAGIEEAEMFVEQSELDEANDTLHALLRNLEDPTLFNETWITLAEFRGRLLTIGRDYREMQEYERALELSELLGLTFPRSDSVRLRAETFEQWASTLAAQKEKDKIDALLDTRAKVREKYQSAAAHYDALAQLELRSAEYPNILWSAIANYQRAGDLERANVLLVDYLRYEERTKRPRGLLALGKNFVDLGQWQKAIEPLERCRIDYPTHPTSFEACLLASKALYELDRLDEASALLEDNLSGSTSSLRPTSDIWRDSLFQLAQTRFRQGDELLLEMRLNPDTPVDVQQAQLKTSLESFLNVVDQLGGFASRYPQDPRHLDALYLIAKSHHLAAETPQQLLAASPQLVEPAKRKLLHQRRQLLEQALADYRKLHQTIIQEQDSLTLSADTNVLVRNCYFGEADTLFELGRWDEAIAAYQNVASRFLNKPESLEALLQMSECYRKLGQKDVAKRVLTQAEQMLGRIPQEYDPEFIRLTRTTRSGWSDLLGSLSKWD